MKSLEIKELRDLLLWRLTMITVRAKTPIIKIPAAIGSTYTKYIFTLEFGVGLTDLILSNAKQWYFSRFRRFKSNNLVLPSNCQY
ncbi:hypothetical protein TVAG_291800 [Trichomonas vaginalis G3]|uniref:Uncharacterized protein n=1 Tax=Trichomonas vaginalis (strain ATCC PRA-98 / G3) TaxID=412133 RepID=A2DQW0_TRIV3|nr:hypothetical protein TVAGG3_0936790 [Trichomonas vaginalis G3]EAY17227.1 hypothetical protein TVAG_291800 [Trichomonas vaginalis G3]KAI5486241.1 hypothetical protein TVAGG3_0936790 [Trichomonas vaginalis G3]|eukprot:XP_001329450.1 hypothetical protein [Trichomonas vaginalis G3]